MTPHVERMKIGYANFFSNTLRKVSFSPIEYTCYGIWTAFDQCQSDKTHGGIDGGFASGLVCSAISTCCLSPVLLPLTAITMTLSGILAVAAALVSPFAFGIAAARDCDCANSSLERETLKPGRLAR
jgi:cytochrome c biogenesis protein CcdA